MAMNKDFGAFELKQKIGAGGMASVYLAVQKVLQRPVVLKILYPHLAEDEKLVARFEREARAAAMMRHENIIQVIDMGRHEDVVYIAMEYVEGMDLKKWIEAHGIPPIEMAVLMLRDLCRGLEHAHGHHIVHRDIKPANVMLTPDGTIKLMDFGLARSGSETSTQMTVVGAVMGTPAYMSPEQATGEVVDQRSDIFSAGVLAYELLGGTRPFSGDSYSTVLRSILTVVPPDVTEFNPLVPEEVARILRGMLEKDVAKRFSSIASLREVLEDVIEQMGLVRGRDLVREYVQDPEGVSKKYRQKRLSRHLDQGIYFENMGLGKIDDALLEFRRVLHLDPENSVARQHVKKLESEREKLVARGPAAAPPAEDRTMVLKPEEAAMLRTPPAPPPAAAPPPAPAPPAAARPSAAAPPPPPAKAPAAPAPARAAAAPAPAPARPAPAPARKPAAPAARPARKGAVVPYLIGAGVLLVVAVAAGIAWLGRPPAPPETTEQVSTLPEVPSAEVPQAPAATDTSARASTGGAAADTAASPLVPAAAAFESGKYDEAVTLLRRTLRTPGLTRREQRAAREMLARSLLRLGRRADASQAFVDLLKAWPSYRPDASFTSDERGLFETARLNLASLTPETTATPPATTPPRATGTVRVNATPYAATFSVDGKVLDENKGQFQASLPAGHHVVAVTHPNLGTREWSVEIAAGQTTTLTHDFRVSAGSIHVSSEPTWGDIYMDGQRVGKPTPWKIEPVRPGRHEITLVRDGWTVEGGAQIVEIRPGDSKSVRFRLKEKK